MLLKPVDWLQKYITSKDQEIQTIQFSLPQREYSLGGSSKRGSHVYFLLIVAMVLLLWCQIVLLWHQITMVASEQHLYRTIVLPRKLPTWSIHDYRFCYCPLMGIQVEVLRIAVILIFVIIIYFVVIAAVLTIAFLSLLLGLVMFILWKKGYVWEYNGLSNVASYSLWQISSLNTNLHIVDMIAPSSLFQSLLFSNHNPFKD